MVQQTDSKFSEYVLTNTETGLLKNDKKTGLRDLQNENRSMVSDTDVSVRLKEDKVAGIKRPHPESTMRSFQQQTSVSTSGPLVYVRRKTESEHKSSTLNKANDEVKKLHEHDEKSNEQHPVNDTATSNHKDVPEQKTSEGVSSTTPIVISDSEKTTITSPVAESNSLQLDNAKGLITQHWEERFLRLQNFLKALDLSNQDDYRQMLRSLSSVALSKIAVELEKRSFQLSVEEAREVQRAKLVDVLDKFPRNAGEHHSMK